MPRLRLLEVFHRENGVGHGQRKVKRHARYACARFVGHQFEVIGFTANDATDGDQRVVSGTIGQPLQRHGHLQRAGHLHQSDVFGLDAQAHQLAQTGFGHGMGDVFVEARLHDADAQLLAIE